MEQTNWSIRALLYGRSQKPKTKAFSKFRTQHTSFLLGIFSGRQNLLSCKFLSLCYCFRTKIQEGAKILRWANCLGGAPPAPLWNKASILVSYSLNGAVRRGTFSYSSVLFKVKLLLKKTCVKVFLVHFVCSKRNEF